MASQARPKTKPGRLSDVARHLVLPDGIVSTGWPAVRDKCREFGDTFDEWQDGAGRAILAKRESGIYAATIDGITLSIPRQVAKTFLVGRIVVALCVLFPGLTVLWTAHHGRTATRTFRSLQAFVLRKKVRPYLAPGPNNGIRTANGEQEIAFRNGSLIMFGAREQGFGRGFEEIDVEVFDEAQILTEKALEDMIAATNQSRHPHGALLFYMGTPPRPGVDPGEAFTAKRQKALAGKMRDGVYIECSADPDADPDDREQWAKANPSYPHRTPLESMLRLRSNLPSDDAWRREALGIWPDNTADTVPGWILAADSESRIVDKPVLAVSMAPDSSIVALVAAGKREDGHLHVETVLHGRPGRWFIDETAKIAKAQRSKVAIVTSHPAGSLISDLETAGVTILKQSRADYIQGCGVFYNATVDGTLHYPPPQPELTTAIAKATRKQAEQSWRWSGEGISALVAASQAVFEASKAPQGGKGRAILLAQ